MVWLGAHFKTGPKSVSYGAALFTRLFYTRWVSPAAQCGREWERKGVVIDRWWLSLLMIPTLRVLSEARLVGVVKSTSLLWACRDLLGSCL